MSNTGAPRRSPRRTGRVGIGPPHISKLLPHDEPLRTDSDDLWPKTDESFTACDGSDSGRPIFNFAGQGEYQLGLLGTCRLPADEPRVEMLTVSCPANTGNGRATRPRARHHGSPIKESPSGVSESVDKSTDKETACPCARNYCSLPRALLAELLPRRLGIGGALENAHGANVAGKYDSLHTLSTALQTNTLRRCWGALLEALDELGGIWDEHEDDSGHQEASPASPDRVRSEPTPVTPAKHSPDKFVTPLSHLRPSSWDGRPSHYDSLTSSPVAGSRSSKRGRKSRPRHKSPTPVRRKHDTDIDPSYSTEDEGSDPHFRLRNKILQQGPPHFAQDNFHVFMYKSDSRTGSVGPDSENNKPNATQDHERRPSDRAELPVGLRRAPIATALQMTAGDSARQSLANLPDGVCQHGVLFGQHMCEDLYEGDCDSAPPHIAEETSSGQGWESDIDGLSMERLRGSRTCSTDRLLAGSSEAVESSNDQASERAPESASHERRVPTPNNLRADVRAIFDGHANGKKAVNRRNSGSKRKRLSEYLKEATRPQHPEAALCPGPPVMRSEADPKKNTSFIMSDDETVHSSVDHPPTRSSLPQSDGESQLTRRSASKLPKAERDIDDWLQYATSKGSSPGESIPPDEPGPSEAMRPQAQSSSSGLQHIPNEPRSSRSRQGRAQAPSPEPRPRPQAPSSGMPESLQPQPSSSGTRKKNLSRQLEKLKASSQKLETCIVMSAAIPPERDTTDLLVTPFITFEPVPAGESSRQTRVVQEGTLMSAFGISCDVVSLRPVTPGLVSSADEAMSHSAAMGSLSILSQLDSATRSKRVHDVRANRENADTTNTSWYELDEARRALDSGPPSIERSRDYWEHRAAYMYNAYCMYQSTISPTPWLTISRSIVTDGCARGLERRMKNA